MKLEDLTAIKNEIFNLRKKLCKAKESYVDEHCPIKPDNKVIIEGYSYTGKSMLVNRVDLIEDYSSGWIWNISGFVINSDGKPGKNYTSFYKEVEE